MFSGGPPVHLMWSNIFNPDNPRARKPAEWRRIRNLFKPYSREVGLVIGCILGASLLGLLPPLFTMWIIDRAIPSGNMQMVSLYVAGIVVSALLGALLTVGQGYLASVMGEGIVRDIRCALVSHMHRMPLDFFTSTKTGEIMNRVSNDVESIDTVLTNTLVPVISNIFTLITTSAAIIWLDWRLALLSMIVVPLMILPIFPVGRQMYKVRKLTREKRDEINALSQETLSISGITLIKLFVREPYERDRFYKVGTDLMLQEVRLAMIGRWFIAVITAMVTIGPAIVWLTGGWLAINKGVTIGVVVTLVTLLGRLYTPASALAGVQVQLVSALAVFERIFDYLDMKAEGADEGTKVIEALSGAVKFDDVQFSYSPDRRALSELSLQIEPGQLAAFVGHSGAGKTTITYLVPRFYDPQTGTISIDGVDIKELKLSSLRSHIGIVTQETYLLHDTIGNNLRYARAGATDEEVQAAARAASIHEFIASCRTVTKLLLVNAVTNLVAVNVRG